MNAIEQTYARLRFFGASRYKLTTKYPRVSMYSALEVVAYNEERQFYYIQEKDADAGDWIAAVRVNDDNTVHQHFGRQQYAKLSKAQARAVLTLISEYNTQS